MYTCSWYEARENVCERVTIGFGFTSDSEMIMCREVFKRINKGSNAKQPKTTVYFYR